MVSLFVIAFAGCKLQDDDSGKYKAEFGFTNQTTFNYVNTEMGKAIKPSRSFIKNLRDTLRSNTDNNKYGSENGVTEDKIRTALAGKTTDIDGIIDFLKENGSNLILFYTLEPGMEYGWMYFEKQ